MGSTITCSPISGPSGALSPGSHFHLCPLDGGSGKLPWVAPKLAGMRCYLSVENLRAFQVSMRAREHTLRKWYERGSEDAQRFTAEHEPPL